jgi:hypothetical protein
MHFIDYLESGLNWNKVFGVVDSVYSDDGFKSNADNFIRSISIERAIEKFSDVVRVDQNGYDFIYNEVGVENPTKVEMKMGKNLFYARDPFTTKKFKVKSFLSATKTVEDFQKVSTFDYLMVIDLTARRVVVVEDEIARPLYESGSDGAMIQLTKGTFYECDIGEVNPITPKHKLSELIDQAYNTFLDF